MYLDKGGGGGWGWVSQDPATDRQADECTQTQQHRRRTIRRLSVHAMGAATKHTLANYTTGFICYHRAYWKKITWQALDIFIQIDFSFL